MTVPLRAAPGELPTRERQLAELNEWIAWLQEWTDKPPGYRSEGPLETTRGLKRLTTFLRGVAYDWPPK